MARVDDALLRRMTAAIVEAADPERVILFGSRARGDAGPDSDVDLVVVEAEPFGPGGGTAAPKRRGSGARSQNSTFRRTSWFTAWTKPSAGAAPSTMCLVLARALREGRVLYERP